MTAPRYTITPLHGAKLDSEGEWMRADEVLKGRRPVPVTVSAVYCPERAVGDFPCDVDLTVDGRQWTGRAVMVRRGVGYGRSPPSTWLSEELWAAVRYRCSLPIPRLIEMACETAIAACVN